MSAELEKRIEAHEADLRQQGKIMSQVTATLDGLVTTVNNLPDEFRLLHDKIDATSNAARPDVKWVITAIGGTLTLLLAAFSVILVLTVDPMRSAINDQDDDFGEHLKNYNARHLLLAKIVSENTARHVNHVSAAKREMDFVWKWKESHADDIKKLREESRLAGERLAQVEAQQERDNKQLNDVDSGGSRRWLIMPKPSE